MDIIHNDGPYGTFSLQAILRLKKGDQIFLFLKQGVYYDCANHFGHFIGFKIRKPHFSESPINFYVQRTSPFSKENSIITFQLERINDGGAMNLESGIFIAPKNGSYYFSLSGIKDNSLHDVSINLRLNGKNIGRAACGSMYSYWCTFSLQSTLKLNKGDMIDLYLITGTFFDDSDHWTHFVGFFVG